jgi:hypothetical protein
MAAGLELGVNQLVVHADLEPASTGWNKRHAFNLRFEISEQVIRQAHGPVGVMSDCTVDDLDFHSGNGSINFQKLYFFLGNPQDGFSYQSSGPIMRFEVNCALLKPERADVATNFFESAIPLTQADLTCIMILQNIPFSGQH